MAIVGRFCERCRRGALRAAVYCPWCGGRTNSATQRLRRTFRAWLRPLPRSADSSVARYAVASLWLAVSLLATVWCGVWYVRLLGRANQLPVLEHLKLIGHEVPDMIGWSIGLVAIWTVMVVLATWARPPQV